MPLTPEQVKIIKATVPVLQEHGLTITTTFYKNMLDAHPELNSVFSTTHQVTGHQPKALAMAVLAYAQHIDDLGALGPTVELICTKHASLYIRPDQYQIVGKYLLEAMGQILGDALTPEIHDAWAAAYWQLADVLIKREEELYKQADGWTDWRDFRIAKRVPESSEITSFYLEPVDGKPLPTFLPGQYISVQLFVPSLKHLQARQFSLSEKPRSDYYRISVKRESGVDPQNPSAATHPGCVSNLLHDEYKEGDTIKVSHPQGDFFLSAAERDGSGPIVLVSAGVGLTPLTSILNTLTSSVNPAATERRIHYIHGARTSQVRAFKSHIESLDAKFPNLHATFFTSQPAESDKQGVDYHHAGRIDLRKLDAQRDLFVDDPKTKYFVCGPTSFMVDMKTELKELGVKGERVKMELFGTGGIPH